MQISDIQTQYIDRHEVAEMFVDHVGPSIFDTHHVRTELQVTRLDEPKPPSPPTGRRYPVCRLVLTVQVAVELHNQLSNFVGVMISKGILKREEHRSTHMQ